MGVVLKDPPNLVRLPTHKDLPDSDGAIVENHLEHPQSIILSDTLQPAIRRRHPDGRFAIGQDSGIYWKITDPPLKGCRSPDWYYVPDVDGMLEGEIRRSYVMWQEHVSPLLLIEYVSGDGSEERDRTPEKGKFWVYEQAIHAAYYVIFDAFKADIEAHLLVDGRYVRLEPNQHGRYEIPFLGIELGLWFGFFFQSTNYWLRVWDKEGRMILTSQERIPQLEARTLNAEEQTETAKRQAEAAKQQAEAAKQQAEGAKQRAETAEAEWKKAQERAERLAAKLKALGVEPNDNSGPSS